MKTYKHLDENERDLIAVLKSKGQSLRKIAQVLGRSCSTLSRELYRNAPPIHTRYYLPHKAQQRAQMRNRVSHQRPRLKNRFIKNYVQAHLRNGWSPELIAGRLKLLHPSQTISHEAIYQWIYEEQRSLIPYLVRSHRKRKHRGYSRKHKKSHIPDRISIKERPLGVMSRRRIGHWETDTMISRISPQAVQVTVERKTRYTKLAKLSSKSARPMSSALARRLSRLPKYLRRSITYDNGSENSEHSRTNRILGTRSYFCEPFHSYERGSVENTIGLVRRFLPKKSNLAIISTTQLLKIQNWLNHRPRKCLNFNTPAELFLPYCCT